MDLLGSILNAMDKPPTANEEQKKLIKRQKEMAERLKNKQKEELLRFRKYVEERIGRFAKDDRHHIEFQPLDKVHRAVIHEVAEYGGFICMSFGCEDIDRYSVVYKKENAPTEDEIAARRNGDGWNDEVAKEYAERRIKQKELELEQKRLARASANAANAAPATTSTSSNNKQSNQSSTQAQETEIKPTFNYKDKYAHLIGQEAALEAARKTETNVSYGFVPSKNKKDMRSIEQTLADIQAKKRLKLQLQQEQQQQQQHLHEQQQQEHHHQHQQAHYASNLNIEHQSSENVNNTPEAEASTTNVTCLDNSIGNFYQENTDLENLNAKLAETTKILDYTPVEKPTELLTSLQKENQEKAVAEELANKALEDENKKKQDEEKNNENDEEDVEETDDKDNEDKDNENEEDEDEDIVEDVEAEDVEPDDEEIEEVEDVEDEVEEEIIPDEVIVPENSVDKIKQLKTAEKDEDEEGEGEEDEEEEGKDKEGDDNEEEEKDDNDEDSQNNEDDESEEPSSSLRASRRQEEEVDENQCRVCCAKDNLVSIFKKLEERTVAEMLMTICPSVSIAIKDFLPQYICNTCCDNVDIAIKLKNQCETTEKELRKKLSRHKNKIRRPVGYVVIDAPLDSDPPTDEEQANDEEFKVSDIASVTPSEDSETSDFSDSKKKKTRGRKRRKSAVVTPTDGKRSKNKSRSDDDSSDENDEDGDPIKQKRKRSSNSSPENFACNECDQTFSRKQSLVLHKRQHVYDRGEPIKCEVCGKKFKIKGAYRTHLEKHREERRANKCNQCSRRFTNSSDLKRHIAEDHREKTILPTCSKCNRTFSSAGRLQRHKQNVCSASDSSKFKKSESHGFAVGTDLFKAVAPLQTTYWSDSFSD